MTRHCPHLKLPDYRYIPGQMPKDEHRSDIPKIKIKNLPPSEWKKNEAYLYGWDLYHHRFFYEAHEVWEAVWMKVGRKTIQGKFLKGLIQLAAAELKREMGELEVAKKLDARVKELFQFVLDSGKSDRGEFMGIRLKSFTPVI